MSPIRVLICEDEGLTSLRMRMTLRRLGYEVVGTPTDGIEGVEAALTMLPDAILMDVEMPRMDGISATRQIMANAPTAILIVSAYSDQESIAAAITAGASGYMTKPVTDDQIEPALCAALTSFARRRQ